MRTRSFSLALGATLLYVIAGRSQTKHPQNAKVEYSEEAAIIELQETKISFDNDGKRSHEQLTQVRVNSDAGIQQWGILSLPYQSATETVEIGYVRVRKPDNTIVATPEDNVQDLDSEITRSAPFYSDLREKHVAVKGLAKGDTLEFQVFWHPIKALIPGQFWFEYNFHKTGIVMNERLEITVPADRAVKFKGPAATQKIETANGVRSFSWSYSRLQNEKNSENDKGRIAAARGLAPAPDVEFSSFQSWEEVGSWYWKLQSDRAEPSPAVKTKAAELTAGLTTDAEKIQALYNFVSTKYRYIGIAFGIGRYQPHAADDVLSNNYGDCKDKHTLLAALLQASGIRLYPALISTAHALDPDVPSPGQFDHIIGYMPEGKEALWLDTTPEVAPLGLLLAPLRDKPALVMRGENAAALIKTPAEPPFANVQSFKIEGKLNDDGSFDAHIEGTSRGDIEVLLRTAFRRIPQSQWPELVQQISYGLGYSGTVSEVSAGAADVTTAPFHFSYSYNRKDFPDWTNHQFSVPGHPFLMPQIRDDTKEALWIGPQSETISDSKVELPKGYTPQIPPDVDLKYDFAEYHAKYSLEGGALRAKRRMISKLHEVPVAELDDYRNFVKYVRNDVDQYVRTSSSAAASPVPVTAGPFNRYAAAVRDLPDSGVADANAAEVDGRASAARFDSSKAMEAFQRAVDSDPKFTRAWLELAAVQLAVRQNEAALDSLVKAASVDSTAVLPHKLYAETLSFLKRNDAALQAWRDILKVAPEDLQANSSVAWYLVQQKHYADALPFLETAAKLDTSGVEQLRLGSAYIKAGQADKGEAALQGLVDKDANAMNLNNVGYELADANVDLPKAQEFAERAVSLVEKRSHDIQLSGLSNDDLATTNSIGSYWDTLGWVEFRLGHLEQAEANLRAAWVLTQNADVADHLGQVYEREKKTDQAIHIYQLAVATPEGDSSDRDDARDHLSHLGVERPTNDFLKGRANWPGDELSKMRTVKLKTLVSGTATAEFFLLMTPGSRITDVLLMSGSERLKGMSEALKAAKFEMPFPPDSSAVLLRRAIVMCSPASGCQAVLYTPNSVRSVK